MAAISGVGENERALFAFSGARGNWVEPGADLFSGLRVAVRAPRAFPERGKLALAARIDA